MSTVRRTRSSQAATTTHDEVEANGEDNNEQTPNAKRTRTDTSTPGTPSSAARMARADEKAELAELNKRLEFYILKQRERDASQDGYQRELTALRHAHEKEMAKLQELHENQLVIVRRSRDEEAEHVTKLEAEAKRRESEFTSIQNQLAAEKRARQQLESKYDQATKDLTYTQQQLFSHEDKAKTTKLELDQAKKTIESLNKQLNEARQRADEATLRATTAETDLADLREEHDILQHHSEEESTRLHTEIHKLSQAAGRNEGEIKRDFEAIMEKHFRERQAQYEADRAAGLAELKLSYDDKIQGYRTSLELLGHDLEKERSSTKRYQQLLGDAQARVSELVAARDTQQRVIADLEEQLAQERVKENPIIAQKNEIIRKIKEAFKRKDEEFDDLMDVKIMLDMEIKAYRTLLESEESRLGYKSPAKKRKRSRRDTSTPEESDRAFSMEDVPNVSSPAPGHAPVKGTQYKTKHGVPSLLISGFDIDGQYITIRNNSTEIVSLKGWKLRAKITQQVFSFPDVRLRPGESFTVRTRQYQQQREDEDKHEDGDTKHDDDDDAVIHQSATRGKTAVWPSAVVWDVAGDEAQLINPAGVIVTVVEVIATGTVRSASSTSTTSSSSYTSSGLTSADSVYTQDTASADGEIGTGEGADKKCIIM